MDYGVLPTGFNRKPLAVILAEIEEAARGVFGAGVIQAAETPLGQLNGLLASILATHWEIAEDAYQSYDPAQAEGVRLEQLGRIRLIERIDGEKDTDFRQAITNADRARIDVADIARAAGSVDGVTWSKVFVNSRCPSVHGLPSRSIAVAALGGDDAEVATSIRPYVVPGVDLYGNTAVDLVIDGYCRTVFLVRPVLIDLGLQIAVRIGPDRFGCPPPSAVAIGEVIGAVFNGPDRPANGQDVTLHLLRSMVATVYPNVEIVSATVTVLPDDDVIALPYPIEFLAMAAVDPGNVTVTVQ